MRVKYVDAVSRASSALHRAHRDTAAAEGREISYTLSWNGRAGYHN